MAADFKNLFLGLCHVHKAHGRRDHEPGAQARFDVFRDLKEGRGRVADGEDRVGVVFGDVVHGGGGTGGAVSFCRLGDEVLRHEAVRRPAQFFKARTADPREGHVGIRHDLSAAPERLYRTPDSTGGEAQVFGIVKIGAGMDAPQDHSGILRREHSAARRKFRPNDFQAAVFDFSGPGLHRRTPP